MAEEPATSPAKTQPKRPDYLVRNNWNQVVSVTLADGSQLHIAARSIVTVPESQLTPAITSLKSKNILTIAVKK